jgi:hypothetical protein
VTQLFECCFFCSGFSTTAFVALSLSPLLLQLYFFFLFFLFLWVFFVLWVLFCCQEVEEEEKRFGDCVLCFGFYTVSSFVNLSIGCVCVFWFFCPFAVDLQ